MIFMIFGLQLFLTGMLLEKLQVYDFKFLKYLSHEKLISCLLITGLILMSSACISVNSI